MNVISWLQLPLFIIVLLLLVKPVGGYMAKVYTGETTFLSPIVRPIEKTLYRIAGINPDDEMNWKTYTIIVLAFNLIGILFTYFILRTQQFLPLNPQSFQNVSPDLSFNTAISFATNTNWQSYGGETTLSNLSQMLALGAQNFLSAAAGMSILIVLTRAFKRQNTKLLGNFWVDLSRSILYILLPISIVLAVALVSQGVVQTFQPYVLSQNIDQGNGIREQLIPLGPVASQVAIKQLGTNGGGFFNVNSSHPFENPTPFSNFLEMLSILLIPAAFTYTFGKMVGDKRQGWALLAVMVIMFTAITTIALRAELSGNPAFSTLGIDQKDGNMEGKEIRFGVVNSTIWAIATTSASNGSVNSMHESLTPIGSFAAMWMMVLGEVIFGGVGSGLYGMLIFAIIAVFVAGLMVGRTPEYLGKKVEVFEMKMASLVVLIPVVTVLLFSAVALMTDAGKSSIYNGGPQGFSEILYAYLSAGNNNGSAFAGLTANTPFFNISLAFAMLISRYALIIPVMALAGSLSQKKIIPAGSGTLPTHTPLFITWLSAVIVIVGALSFIPALALGPIVQQLLLATGKLY